ncbi:MAG: glycosyltransferase [Candidatus Hydrogenedentota bacterium]|nr:MAG: glycosyltransferase [Candidatus Hydrogenedentota bacterium]
MSDSLDIQHTIAKEDDDPILEYMNVDISNLESKKVYLADIPFYQASDKELIAYTFRHIEQTRKNGYDSQGELAHILPLDPYRFVWIRNSKKYLPIARTAFLNLPSGSGIRWMSRRLKAPLPQNISLISFLMNLIRIAHAKEYTIFLLGSKDEVIEKLFFNLTRSFPRLRIVGRHNGYLKGPYRERVVQALKKTNPHIILLGLGFHKEMAWIREYKDQLGNSVLINVGGSLDILAGTRKKAPDFIVEQDLTWFWRMINRPWRWHRLFILLWWLIETLYWKFTSRKKNES